jgi:predicted transcriptional regulator
MMVQYDCGEIPVLDITDRPIGVVTDRNMVCRVVAEARSPMAHPAETCMSDFVVTPYGLTLRFGRWCQRWSSTRSDVLVVDAGGCCIGIISQADVASVASRPALRTGA